MKGASATSELDGLADQGHPPPFVTFFGGWTNGVDGAPAALYFSLAKKKRKATCHRRLAWPLTSLVLTLPCNLRCDMMYIWYGNAGKGGVIITLLRPGMLWTAFD